MGSSPPKPRAWHGLSVAEVCAALDTSERGLDEAEAARRLESHGPNELPAEPEPAWWKIALAQFRSPLIYILGIAALVSLIVGEAVDAGFIAVVLLINAAIGGWQEYHAERSARALRRLLRVRASVERGGEVREIPAERLVPGDLVWVGSGDRVPADMRLVSAQGLRIDESLLTGESIAVAKDAAGALNPQSPLGDRTNMAHAGSTVAHGRARGIVVNTGAGTVVGQLALSVSDSAGGKPPLIERMERFTRAIAVTVLAMTIVIGILGVVLGRYSISEMFVFAVALAVSAIPEGLPVALTVALSIATTRMARRGVIVRRLAAVEGLGSCTLIATDKTGTLTCNELTVREIRLATGERFEVTGEGFLPRGEVLAEGRPVEPGSHPGLDRLARAAVLANEGDLHRRDGDWTWRGDTVDVALLSMAQKLAWRREVALEVHPQEQVIPYEPERRFAASFHASDGRTLVAVKGAPERILSMCAAPPPNATETAEALAARGLRVLAIAEGELAGPLSFSDVPPEPRDLTLLGFAGMMDPLRAGVREAVKACRRAGVQVAMVTGDHRVTALAIARDLDLVTGDGQLLTGSEMIEMSREELGQAIDRIRVFARVAPDQKLDIVHAARAAGHFVAVTGDGVNDAPALRAANIGVAMGRGGTDVAREAAELVISDDNFATIVNGVDEGRIAYDNVRKVIYLLVATGAAELVLVGLAVVAGLPLPLLPAQLLWLNLVTNGIQDVALAFEPGEEDVLRRPPRPPRERIFNRLMVERTVLAAVVIGTTAFVAFRWLLGAGWGEAEARNAILLLMVLFENVQIGNCRSETRSAFLRSPLANPVLLAGAVTAFLVHVAAMHVPFLQHVLGTGPVSLETWALLVALALVILPVMELHKWTWARRSSRRS